jgi:23S rRNA (guanosine2251-2'-O)-methyltransferase
MPRTRLMARAGIGTDLAGFHAVAAAVASGRVRVVYVERSRLRHDDVEALVSEAKGRGASVEVVDDVRPLTGTDQPQGIAAEAEPIEAITLEGAVASGEPPALVVLDHVEDPRNIGAIVRSMAAAGIGALVVPDRRSAPLGATAFKAAAGAFESMAVSVVTSIPDAISRLGKLGVWTVGLSGSGERSLIDLELLSEPCALVLGSEGQGISRLVEERVDIVARIPMQPGVESLNVSAAATLASYEMARARGRIH